MWPRLTELRDISSPEATTPLVSERVQTQRRFAVVSVHVEIFILSERYRSSEKLLYATGTVLMSRMQFYCEVWYRFR